jgi:protein-L-isoaspartate(D-aspartate) O-methyltransferase
MADSYADARLRMVEHQILSRGIFDTRVLEVMATVPRHLFVAEEHRHEAYADQSLEIGYEQTISQPYIVALMAAALDLQEHDKVLEIGTGSGYAAAVLSMLCGEVHTVERNPMLAEAARQRLRKLGYDHVHVHDGDGVQGWAELSPYDAISVAAAGAGIPRPLVGQLDEGGRLILPVGDDEDHQSLIRIRKLRGNLLREELAAVRFVPLVGATL